MRRLSALLPLLPLLWAATAVPAGELPATAPSVAPERPAFVHPGMLHSEDDFNRMRAHLQQEPWKSGWERLLANRFAGLKYKPSPAERITRGKVRGQTDRENYGQLFRDAAAAYADALRWRISGEEPYGAKAVEILNAWSATLKEINLGPSDSRLASGIYGYELSNAAEIMRSFSGWKPEDFERFQKMMEQVFLPVNDNFLDRHNGQPYDHYWTNWDACNMASMMAIGILCDDRAPYDKAVDYYKHGKGMGAIENAVYFVHPGGLGQWQESGRDQPHSMMGLGILAAVCEMAWHQGEDLYGYDDNRLLAGAEYIAKYNLGEDVPFKTYTNKHGTADDISDGGRGGLRPVWEILFNHYVKRKGLSAPYTTAMAAKARPEGGGGDYGMSSGGFDSLGFGTLTFSRDPDKKVTSQP